MNWEEIVKKEKETLDSIIAQMGEWLINGEIDYLRMWCFEYVDLLAKEIRPHPTASQYNILQIHYLYGMMEEQYLDMMIFVESEQPDYERLIIDLPTIDDMYKEIRRVKKEKLDPLRGIEDNSQ
jgi:hypothetical protein